HSLAIKTNGKLYAWGLADIRLGLGNVSANVLVPTQVGTDSDWKFVKGGNRQSTGIKTSGALYTWGHNEIGELGDGTTTDRNVPTHIGTATDWTASGAGNDQIYVLKPDGTLFVVGDNQYGSLGTGNTTNLTVLTPLNCPTSFLQTETFEAKPSCVIYPNPTSSILNIKTLNNTPLDKITISDLTGKVVLSLMNTSQVKVESLAKGMYLIEAVCGEEKFISKFIKE
ncbi:MAG: T9SS type A sorting domain-containing protein, partial [Flavobacterium sp.]